MKKTIASGRIIAGKTYYWENWGRRHLDYWIGANIFVWGGDYSGYYPNLDEYQLLDAPIKIYQN